MILSKRERYILIAVVVVVGIFVLDKVALTPLLERRKALDTETSALNVELIRAGELRDNRKTLEQKWKAMALAGLKTDASAAESMMLRSVSDWAQESRLTLSSMKQDRTEADKQFQKVVFRATATGNMESMTRFLYRVRNATIPVRVTELQLSSRKDGTDDLTMQIGLTTIYYSPATPGSRTGQAAQASVVPAAGGAQRVTGASSTQPQSRPTRGPE